MILVPSLLGFANKFREFILIFRGDVDGVFAITPIVNYLLASLGFFFLFCWAICHGMFRDIERPKYAMLETERQLDEQDGEDLAGPRAGPEDLTERSDQDGTGHTHQFEGDDRSVPHGVTRAHPRLTPSLPWPRIAVQREARFTRDHP